MELTIIQIENLIRRSRENNEILYRYSFHTPMSYYRYLGGMLYDCYSNKRCDLCKQLVERIKDENILLNIDRNSNTGMRITRALVSGLVPTVFYIGDKDLIKWLIDVIEDNFQHLWTITHKWIMLINAYNFNSLRILLDIFEEKKIILYNLVFSMDNPDAKTFRIASIIVDEMKLDIEDLLSAYNKGLGTVNFRLWFDQLIMNQV